MAKHHKKPGRGAVPSRSPSREPSAPPGWLMLVAGLVGGFLVAFLVMLLRVQPDKAALASAAAPAEAKAKEEKPKVDPSAPKPRFDFYTLLPESETLIPDGEGQQGGQSSAQPQVSQQPAQPPAPQPVATAQPAPAAPAPAQPVQPVAAKPVVAASAPEVAKPTAPAPAPAVVEAPAANEELLLQAGAFRTRAEADRRKAEISFLGMGASIQSVQRGTETWHRVIVGPFGNRDQMASARAKLQGAGVPTVMFKRKS